MDEATGKELEIRNIPKDVDREFLLLYLESILEQTVEAVNHTQGNDSSVAVMRDPISEIAVQAGQRRGEKEPLLNQALTLRLRGGVASSPAACTTGGSASKWFEGTPVKVDAQSNSPPEVMKTALSECPVYVSEDRKAALSECPVYVSEDRKAALSECPAYVNEDRKAPLSECPVYVSEDRKAPLSECPVYVSEHIVSSQEKEFSRIQRRPDLETGTSLTSEAVFLANETELPEGDLAITPSSEPKPADVKAETAAEVSPAFTTLTKPRHLEMETPMDALAETAAEESPAPAALPKLEHLKMETPADATTETATKVDAPSPLFKDFISVSPEQLKLTEDFLPGFGVEESCSIRADETAEQIVFEGEETAVLTAKLKVYEKLASFTKLVLSDVSPEMARRLLTAEGQAALAKSNFSGGLSVQDDGIYLTVNKASAEETVKKLKDLIQCRGVPVKDVYRPFLQSQEWQALVDRLQTKFIVVIRWNLDDEQLLISGIDACAAMEELQAELQQKALTKETLRVETGIGRFIKTYESELCQKLRSRSVTPTIISGETEWLIELSGQVEAASAAKKELQEVIDSIQVKKEEICKPGARAFFESNSGRRALKGIEFDRHCIVEVLPCTKDPGRPQAIRFGKDKHSMMGYVTLSEPTSGMHDSAGATATLKVREGEQLVFRHGGVSLILALGDITQYEADVLVNTLGADSKKFARAGAVGRAFKASGGEELEKEYLSAREGSSGSLIKTSAKGNLQCQHVYHVQVKSWDKSQEQELRSKLRDCLNECVTVDKLTSIAFPTVGCGYLRYPVDIVADCFRKEIVKLADNGHTVKVTVVAFDEQTRRKMAAAYNTGTKSKAPKMSESKDSQPPTTPTSTCLSGPSYSALASVVLQVSAKSSQELQDTFQDIEDQLLSALVEKEPIDCEELEFVSEEQLDCLESLNSRSVAVSVDQKSGYITLAGITKEVNTCREKVDAILKKTDSSALTGGQRLFYLSQRPITVPDYWIQDETAGKKRDRKNRHGEAVLLNANPRLTKAVTDLVYKAWQGKVGAGGDARNLTHTRLEVRRVQIVENLILWQEYNMHKKKLMERAAFDAIPPIAGKQGERQVFTCTLDLQDLDELLEKEINEVFLFHGTRPENWNAIVNQGYDCRLVERAYFGNGVYFAEKSTKADQYADYAEDRKKDEQFMFVSRVLLGNAYICRVPFPFRRPPCSESGCLKPGCKTHQQLFDSVVGTHRKEGNRLLFREFIVYENGHCYPEFLVTYVRK